MAAAAPSPPGLVQTAPRILVVGEYVALVMTFLSLVMCTVTLFVSLGGALWPPKGEEAPPYTGKQEDYLKQTAWNARELHRLKDREEHRLLITQAVALLAGTAIGFLALALLVRAARAAAEDPKPTPGMHLARFVPGLVALACATVILTFALSHTPEQPLPTTYPYIAPAG
jgi:hypothetical protein